MSFNNKTIEELHDLLVSKEISATELTQATLDDIKAREEAVNAFVTVAEEAALARTGAAMLDELRRHVVAGDQDIRERLVVAQQHVVARLIKLDVVVFQQ